jgi:hypothetical protein
MLLRILSVGFIWATALAASVAVFATLAHGDVSGLGRTAVRILRWVQRYAPEFNGRLVAVAPTRMRTCSAAPRIVEGTGTSLLDRVVLRFFEPQSRSVPARRRAQVWVGTADRAWRGARLGRDLSRTRDRTVAEDRPARRRTAIGAGDLPQPLHRRARSGCCSLGSGALRRSEIVGLNVSDLRFEGEGVVLRLRRSKTNQEGALEEVAVLYGSDPHTCPVRALQTGLAISGLVSRPLFRAVDRAGRIGAGRLNGAHCRRTAG